MTEARHAPEPWEWDGANRILAGNETLRVAGVALSMPNSDETYANAARIVACVNALAGYNPEAVKELIAAVQSAPSVLTTTRALAALANLEDSTTQQGGTHE